jgi:drug/metabolite transporter (DMT)-like permease
MFADYFLILLSTAMFGCGFICQDLYRRERKSSVLVSLQYSFISSAVSLIVFLAFNGFRFSCTPFVFIMALISAASNFGFTYCSFKSLGIINLSLYSLFSMLGGMMLPFLQGILFYGEPVTVANLICFFLILIALGVTFERNEKRKGGTLYYIGVFTLNGLSGVLSKIFNEAAFDKGATPQVSYSVMSGFLTMIIAGLLILYFSERVQEQQPRMSLRSNLVAGAGGLINRVANYILTIALLSVPASVQYPMVTGGVMIFSTLACFLMKVKPSKRELISIAIAFIALVVLVLPPLNIHLFAIRF